MLTPGATFMFSFLNSPFRLFYNPLHRSLHKFNRQPDYPGGNFLKYQKGFTWRHAWGPKNKKNLIPTTLYRGYDYQEHKTGFMGDSEAEKNRKKEGSAVFSNGTLMQSCDPKSHFLGVNVQLNDDRNEKPWRYARQGGNYTTLGDKKGIVNVMFYCDDYTEGEGLKKRKIDVKNPLRSRWEPNDLYPGGSSVNGYMRDYEKEMPGLFIDVSK